MKNEGIHAAVAPQEVTADIIKEVYDIAVEIHYHKGFPLVIPN